MSDGVATRYADFGKGEKVVVLLHGYLEAIEVFDDFAGELGKHFRVITIDLPGHGMTDWGGRQEISIDFSADVVAGVLTKAGLSGVCVVGHSMGGYVALALAQNHPQMVGSVVLLHSSPNGDTPERKENRQREIDAVVAGKKELLASVNPARGFAQCNCKRCEDVIDELYEQVMMTDDQAIVAVLRGMMSRADRSDFFGALAKPRLMIFGTDDGYIPVEAAQAMIDRYAPQGVQCQWVEKAGHMGFVEQRGKVVEIIAEFLKTI